MPLTAKQPIKIGSNLFSSFEEYKAAYIKEWDRLHLIVADENWILSDWNMRVSESN